MKYVPLSYLIFLPRVELMATIKIRTESEYILVNMYTIPVYGIMIITTTTKAIIIIKSS